MPDGLVERGQSRTSSIFGTAGALSCRPTSSRKRYLLRGQLSPDGSLDDRKVAATLQIVEGLGERRAQRPRDRPR